MSRVSHFLLLFFLIIIHPESSYVLSVGLFYSYFHLSALVHSSLFFYSRKAQSSLIWVVMGGTLTVSQCSVSDELLMTSLHLWVERTSEVLFTHPLLSAHLIICPFSLPFFFWVIPLDCTLTGQRYKGSSPSLSLCAEFPHRNILDSHTDEDDLSNDWQWEGLKGVWIISEAWLFDSSFGQWIS